ncbi:YrrS family protein [Sutcliffiella sp. NPDC057660]|uniref:YrrS family protein n=1 Tax=Sutcliffiella sp. NPDC057660 TaxID=3346199 RepID=UPI0036AD5FEE
MSLNHRDGSRYGRTTKRKKSNLVLNVLIGLVFIFIIFLGTQLFFGKSDDKQVSTNEQELNETAGKNDDIAAEENEESAPEEEEESDSKTADEEKPADEEESEENTDENTENEDSETQVSENSDDPNVIKTMTNPGWAPVGTSQSEPHTSAYEEGHVDWDEKLKAVSAATGLASGDYTLYFLGNGGSEHHSVASIKNKASGENFKIYLEWVTGKGWKPTKVEQVKSL